MVVQIPIADKKEAGPFGLSTTHESSSSPSTSGDNGASNIESGDDDDNPLSLEISEVAFGNVHNISNAVRDLDESFAARVSKKSGRNEISLSDVATNHESSYAMANDPSISNQFWWDYHELQAELRSKEAKIGKVKGFPVSLQKKIH